MDIKTYRQAAQAMQTRMKNKWFREAESWGLLNNTFSAAELSQFRKSLSSFREHPRNVTTGKKVQEVMGRAMNYPPALYEKNEQLLKDKEAKIKFLESKITDFKAKELRFEEISTEVKMNYNEVEKISYYNKITTNFKTTDTIPVIEVIWNKNYPKKNREKDMLKLDTWLRYKLKLDTIQIID